MNLFNIRKPRGFQHEYMYVDPQKDKLDAIEQRVKEQLGQAECRPDTEERLRGVFLNATKYARRRKANRLSGAFFLNTGVAIILLLVLIAVWKILLSL